MKIVPDIIWRGNHLTKVAMWVVFAFIGLSILLPVSAFAFFKSTRVIMPEVFGASCQNDYLCVMDAQSKFKLGSSFFVGAALAANNGVIGTILRG